MPGKRVLILIIVGIYMVIRDASIGLPWFKFDKVTCAQRPVVSEGRHMGDVASLAKAMSYELRRCSECHQARQVRASKETYRKSGWGKGALTLVYDERDWRKPQVSCTVR